MEDRDLAARLEAVDGLGSPDWLANPDTAGWLREAAAAAGLELERRAASLAQWEPLVPALRLDAPRAFAPDTDLSSAEALANRADTLADPADTLADPGGATPAGSGSALAGWWRRRRWRRADRRLRAAPQVPMTQLRAAIVAARASPAAARLAATGGTELGAPT